MIKKHKVPIKHLCSFGNEGYIDTLYIAECLEDLKQLIKSKRNFFILGKGSNTIINPKHSYDAIIQLAPHLFKPEIKDQLCWLGANLSIYRCLKFLIEAQCTGLEFSAGIPASIGGMLYMNFGCWQQQISDDLVKVECLSKSGEHLLLNKKELNFNYRY
eukprot:COSAG05_NODE_10843_length_543_cov_0.806306_1_plen_158_part_10